MEWNSGKSHLIRSTFHSHQSPSFKFIHNYNHQYWSGTTEAVDEQAIMMRDTHESTQDAGGMREMVINDENKQVVVQLQQQESGSSNEKKKVRMTSEQLEFLESRFQEDIKLEPDRKIKLARELGLQPRQVAVWFQNRRARWKTKQLEHLYFSVKHQLDLVSMEKDKLQQEVVALRAILKEEVARKQQQLVWENWNNNNNNNNNNDTDHMISCKDTMESTSVFSKFRHQKNATARDDGQNSNDNIIANNHEFNGALNNIDEYNNIIIVPSLIGTAVMHSYH